MEKLLIVGGVAAGATAAARARRLNGEIEITLLEAGEDVSFANCGLPYYLGREVANRSDLILASPETFDDQYKVKVLTNTMALSIDRANKELTAQNQKSGEKQTFSYDKLILAQGGKPIVPPLPGVELPHVFQLWTLSDMDRIDTFIKESAPETAVVVGAGFIGLEMVEALVHRGLQVTLVEKAPQVMPNLEAEIAGHLTKELLEHGVDVRLGASLKEVQANSILLEDGTKVNGDLVLLSIGVKPTLQLAIDAGLELGEAGGLLVDEQLRTNDPDIYAAGDMLEIANRVTQKRMRVPLAGPANRQGRIAAENALGGSVAYRGSLLSSIVKLFDAVAASTGLNLQQARDAGFDADAVVVHKASHTNYYPGAERVTLQLVFEKSTGKILGAQAAGSVGVDKRIDVVGVAMAAGMSVAEFAELDFAYAPPFNGPNGPEHMAAFTAENHRIGFSPSILARDLETFLLEKEAIVLDLRDPISFAKAHLEGSQNVSQSILRDNIDQIPRNLTVILISDDGQKGHVSLRMLKNAGFDAVYNLSGGYISLERQARIKPYQALKVGLFPLQIRTVEAKADQKEEEKCEEPSRAKKSGVLLIDVRTPMEFEMGAVADAINIPLDQLPAEAESAIGDKNREVIVYCASGARSAYAVRLLNQMGYTDVTNGGGLHDMMARVSSLSLM